jgi:hypothetical protein
VVEQQAERLAAGPLDQPGIEPEQALLVDLLVEEGGRQQDVVNATALRMLARMSPAAQQMDRCVRR